MIKTDARIAIIGAGISGLCTALELCERGYAIDLYDPQGFPARNASFIAGGMLAPWSETEHLPQSWRGAAEYGLDFWRKNSTSFRRTGTILLSHAQDDYILQRFQAHIQSEESAPYELLNKEQIQNLEPMCSHAFTKGIYLSEEGYLHPQKTMEEILRRLDTKRVRMLKKAGDPDTLTTKYDVVIDCRGIGASTDDTNLRGVKGESILLENKEFSLSRPIRLMHPRYPLYIVPQDHHTFMIGATNIECENSAEAEGSKATNTQTYINLRSAMELLSAAFSLHPSFADAQILEIRAAVRPAYPDNLPRITKKDSIICCNGLFRHGYLLSPALALCVADTLEEKQNPFMSLVMHDVSCIDRKTA